MRGNEAIADDELWTLMAGFSTPFTPVYKRWNYVEKVSLCPTFWTARRGSEAARLARQDIAAS
jgi:hypothetical protein